MAYNFAGSRFEIILNWKIAVFYLSLMPVLLYLGFWQIERAEEKRLLEHNYQQRLQAAPISLGEALSASEQAYVRVALTGYYDNDRLFLLDNKIYQGKVGYEVVAPFVLEQPISYRLNGAISTVELVWVNRGWISLGGTRERLPEIPAVEFLRTIVAGIDIPPGEAFVLSDEPFRGSWPEVVQKIDIELMSERYSDEMGLAAAPFMVRLADDSPGELQTIWQPINMSPAKHLGYALQWFSMALALTILYFYVTIKRIRDDDGN